VRWAESPAGTWSLSRGGVLSACGSGAAPGGGGRTAERMAAGRTAGRTAGRAEGRAEGRTGQTGQLGRARKPARGHDRVEARQPGHQPGLVEGYAGRSRGAGRAGRAGDRRLPGRGTDHLGGLPHGALRGQGRKAYAGGTLPGAQSQPRARVRSCDRPGGGALARGAGPRHPGRAGPALAGRRLPGQARARGRTAELRPFVLREDDRDADSRCSSRPHLAAYNHWGGESLYASTRFAPGRRAVEVSFDRPIHPTTASARASCSPWSCRPSNGWSRRATTSSTRPATTSAERSIGWGDRAPSSRSGTTSTPPRSPSTGSRPPSPGARACCS
jgi:hypothetical protein